MNQKKLDTIVIVGGGTAGWMAAASLSKILKNKYTIRLIESDEISTVGVGESTIPMINRFNDVLGINEDVFMRETRATFKLGIEFVDWGHIGERYMHGFGNIGQDLLTVDFYQYWLKMYQAGKAPDLEHYSINRMAARQNKFMRADRSHGNSPLGDIVHAFHLDAGLYARYLRKYSEGHGVTRIEGKVVDTLVRASDGHVDAVRMENGELVGGELFIDCSGFRGLLIEQALHTGHDDWSEWLPCDRAWAVPCASSGALLPYTRATARPAGWQWRIGLQHRTGNGHVYSSGFTSDEQAGRVLLDGLDGTALDEPRQLRFVTGRRRKSWVKNVVAIGLSAGFVEPLESTSINLIETAVGKLLELFPDRDCRPELADEFNRFMGIRYESVRDFIVLHYKLTKRDDSEFWRYCANMAIPDSLRHQIELFRQTGRVAIVDRAGFAEPSFVAMMMGLGVVPKRYDPLADRVDVRAVHGHFAELRSMIAQAVARMPDHGAYVAGQAAVAGASSRAAA